MRGPIHFGSRRWHLLNNHAMEAPRQPAVTADSLGGTDLAQNALAAAAGDGKNYPYVYPRGDIETAVEDTRQALENAIKGALMSADHYREQGDTEQAERQEQLARQSREELETNLADARRQLEREAELAKDAIPAQEAANIAGVWMEQAYGMEIGDTPLELSLHYVEEKPTAWTVAYPHEEKTANNPTLARVYVDALTGSCLLYTSAPTGRCCWRASAQTAPSRSWPAPSWAPCWGRSCKAPSCPPASPPPKRAWPPR